MRLPWDAEKKPESGKQSNRDLGRSADPYHTARWTRLSRAWRMEHPLCEECRKRGVIKSAQVVDHIVPWPACGDFFDRTNLQSLCSDCNIAKGNRDKKVIAEWKRTQQ